MQITPISLVLVAAIANLTCAQEKSSKIKEIGSASANNEEWFNSLNAAFDPKSISKKTLRLNNGTGVLLDQTGHFLTNNHIVRECLIDYFETADNSDEDLVAYGSFPSFDTFPVAEFLDTAKLSTKIDCSLFGKYVAVYTGERSDEDVAAEQKCNENLLGIGANFQAIAVSDGDTDLCASIDRIADYLGTSCIDRQYTKLIFEKKKPCNEQLPTAQEDLTNLSRATFESFTREITKLNGYEVYGYELISYYPLWYSIGVTGNSLRHFQDTMDVVLAKIINPADSFEGYFNLYQGMNHTDSIIHDAQARAESRVFMAGYGSPKYSNEVLEAQAEVQGLPIENFNEESFIKAQTNFTTGKLKKLKANGNYISYSVQDVLDESGLHSVLLGDDISASYEILDGSKGNSGSPVFTNEPAPRLVGVYYGSRTNDATGINSSSSIVSTKRAVGHYFKPGQPESAEDAADLSDDIRTSEDGITNLWGFDIFYPSDIPFND